MRRREVIRRGSAGLAALGASALAGCSGEDEAEAEGEITNSIDELAVESTTVRDDTGPRFELDVRVENVGDETVDLAQHTMELTLLGEGDEDLTGQQQVDYPNRASEPGETREVQFRVDVTTDAQDVVRWTLDVYCHETFDDGGYCG